MTKLFVILFIFLLVPFAAQAQTIVRSFSDSVLLEGHTKGVFSVDINQANEAIVASSSEDKSIIVWDWTTKQKIFKKQFNEKATQIVFSRLGKALAFSGDFGVHVLSTSDWSTLHEFKVPLDARYSLSGYVSASCLRFSPDDRLLAAGFKTEVIVWDLTDGHVVGRYDEGGVENWDCKSLEFSADGSRLMGLMQNQFQAWRIADSKPTGTPPFKRMSYAWLDYPSGDAIALSKDFQYVAFGAEPNLILHKSKISIQDLSTGEVIQTITSGTKAINVLKYSEDGCCILVGSRDGTTRIFDVATRQEISRLEDTRSFPSWFYSLASATRAGVVVSGDIQGEIRVWKPK